VAKTQSILNLNIKLR